MNEEPVRDNEERPPVASVVQQPPPLPTQSIEYGTPATIDPLNPYQRVADTVGFVPSLRWRDNLIQLAAGALGALCGFIAIPYYVRGIGPAPILGAILGFIGGVVASGIVLGILRLIGALRRRP